jgi:hypothetical protein
MKSLGEAPLERRRIRKSLLPPHSSHSSLAQECTWTPGPLDHWATGPLGHFRCESCILLIYQQVRAKLPKLVAFPHSTGSARSSAPVTRLLRSTIGFAPVVESVSPQWRPHCNGLGSTDLRTPTINVVHVSQVSTSGRVSRGKSNFSRRCIRSMQ